MRESSLRPKRNSCIRERFRSILSTCNFEVTIFYRFQKIALKFDLFKRQVGTRFHYPFFIVIEEVFIVAIHAFPAYRLVLKQRTGLLKEYQIQGKWYIATMKTSSMNMKKW